MPSFIYSACVIHLKVFFLCMGAIIGSIIAIVSVIVGRIVVVIFVFIIISLLLLLLSCKNCKLARSERSVENKVQYAARMLPFPTLGRPPIWWCWVSSFYQPVLRLFMGSDRLVGISETEKSLLFFLQWVQSDRPTINYGILRVVKCRSSYFWFIRRGGKMNKRFSSRETAYSNIHVRRNHLEGGACETCHRPDIAVWRLAIQSI